jgi:nucleoside-diphosphate-sugar epimerase
LLDETQRRNLIETVRPTHLVHLAWYTEHGKFWTAPENLRWLQASIGLVKAFADSGGKRAVFAGTCAEYDWTIGACSDAVPGYIRPATLYGACKASLFQAAERFCQQAGVSLAWGRIFFPYGPHESPARLVPSVIRSLLAGREAACSSGEQVRDFLHAADVAGAFVALLESEVKGAVNIGSGEGVALKDVVATIGEELGRPELIRLGALPTRPGDPPRLVADGGRLSSEVGWGPSYGLASGLRDVIGWWRSQ